MPISLPTIALVIFSVFLVIVSILFMVAPIIRDSIRTTATNEPLTRRIMILFVIISATFASWALLTLFLITRTMETGQNASIIAECLISDVIALVSSWFAWQLMRNQKP
jgi:hypothetical protein